jgi:hypothetical protein
MASPRHRGRFNFNRIATFSASTSNAFGLHRCLERGVGDRSSRASGGVMEATLSWLEERAARLENYFNAFSEPVAKR